MAIIVAADTQSLFLFVDLCIHRYENIVQIRCLYEGVAVQDMLDTWHKMLPAKMKQWGLDRQAVSSQG